MRGYTRMKTEDELLRDWLGSVCLWMGFKEKSGKPWTRWPLESWHVRLELSGPHPALTGSWVPESYTKNSRRRSCPSLVKLVEQMWVHVTSRRSREQNQTVQKHSEIPLPWETSALLLDLIIKLQVMLAYLKEIVDLTLGMVSVYK